MLQSIRAGRLRSRLALLTTSVAAVLLLFAAPQPADAQQQASEVAGRATWDERYLYFTFQVDDPDILGTHSTPMSRPEEDDSVGVYLQVGREKPDAPNADTHAMLVSAAGGFTFLRGENGKFVARPLFSIKYAVTIQGTLNRSDDRDQRYVVEMAIPWTALGLEGTRIAEGTEIGFNVVTRARRRGLSSLATGVTTEAEVAAPAKWPRLRLAGAVAATDTATDGEPSLVAPRVNDRVATVKPPLIDGVQRPGEWPAAPHRFAFAAPETVAAPVAAVVTPPVADPPPVAAFVPLNFDTPVTGMERLIMARYVLGYQGDTRRAIGFRGVRDPASGGFLLRDQPLAAAGPWFSADRLGWHRIQFAEMRRAGVDVALTVIGGPGRGASLAAADDKALLVMVAALRRLSVESIPAPQVALFLDTNALTPPNGPKPDLSKPEGRALVYAAIRRWMAAVPPEMRARVQVPPERGGVAAFPIFLSEIGALGGTSDKTWVEDLRKQFAAEGDSLTGGATVIFVGGGSGGGAPAPGLAAVLPTSAGKGSGAVATFVVQPGVDSPDAPLVGREDGKTYRAFWEAALEAAPTWFILDSWNDWERGTEVAASRQYGPRYLDMTRVFAIQMGGLQPRNVKWLGHNAPRRLRPGQIVTTDVLLQNAGALPLRAADGIAVVYRWLQNGQTMGESLVRIPLPGSVLPTQTAQVAIGLAAVRTAADGRLEPMPPGEYTVQIDLSGPPLQGAASLVGALTTTTPVLFGDAGDTPLTIPVAIASDVPAAVDFASATLPPLLRSGETYDVSLRVRWRGAEPLAADAANLTCQVLSADGKTTIATATNSLAQTLNPGQWATLTAPLRLMDAGGAPLAPASPELLRTSGGESGYQIRWLLTGTQSVEALPGQYVQQAAVYPAAEEQAGVVLPPSLPTTIEAERITSVEVTIVNRGSAKWARNTMAVGYHWYFPDGVEAVWKPAVTAPIEKEVGPGKSVKVRVPVRAPERDGPYVLAFDVTRAGAENGYLSTQAVTPSDDLGLTYLRVTGGRLTFVDLTRFFDVDGVASEAAPADGDLDGTGATLPAESFPPDLFGLNAPRPAVKEKRKKELPPPAYPSGYYSQVSPTARLISFRYGSDADGAKNALACVGQTIPIPPRRYGGLHLAAVATDGTDRTLSLTLHYKDGTTQKTIARPVGDWNRAPGEGDPVAILAHRKRTPTGDLRAISAVRHVIVPVAAGKELIAVTMPKDSAIKVFALTLER